jgi:CubicO group peptidase (beta-lactamase class C family)/tetratricopeptide (TPR) repeat protein
MDHLPDTSFDVLDLELALQVEELCQRFEAEWRLGRRPCVELYLAEVAEPGRAALSAELAALERELSDPLRGRSPSAANFDEPTYSVEAVAPSGVAHPLVGTANDEAQKLPRTVHQTGSMRGSAASFDLRPQLGDYEIIREIARGGMGVVFQARQRSLNRLVALKMILAGQFADEADVVRFRLEAEAAAKLDHSGIVPVYEVGEYQGHHYFSMGFVDGPSLSERLAQGPLAPREAAGLVRRVCAAIDYAHRHGVVHRDLKPANILLDSDGNPRVTDFGLAKMGERDSALTGSNQIMGTPSYMSPEQAGGLRGAMGPAVDIYALGATLYCLVTGRPPFQAASPVDTVLQVINNEPISPRRLNPAVDRDLETICLKCLEKDPARRYASAAALGEDLRRHVEGEPIVARPATAWDRALKWARRKPAIASLAASLALAIIVGFPAVTGLWVRAESNRAEAERRRTEAEANLMLAIATVDDFHTRVSQSRQLQVPSLQGLRRELLTAARKIYEDFVVRKVGDGGLQKSVAGARLRVAKIDAELDGPASAATAFRTALDSYELVAANEPDDPQVRAGLADSLRGLALSESDPAVSLSLFRRAQTIRAALVAEAPRDENLLLELARVEVDLAEALQAASRPAESLPWYERAREIEERLVGSQPDDAERLATLGETTGRMAILLDRTANHAEASALRLEAIEYVREASDRAPWVIPFARTVSDLYRAEAETRRALKDQEGTIAALAQSVAASERVARENRDVPGIQAETIRRLRDLADALLATGRPADFARQWARLRDAIAGLPSGSAENLYQAACVLSRVVEPEPLGATERRESARNADAALDALSKAVASGFRDIVRLRREPALAGLRDHAGFRALIEKLERTRALETSTGVESPGTTARSKNAARAEAGVSPSRAAAAALQERILGVREGAARARPGDPIRRAELARIEFALGRSRLGIGNWSAAFELLDRARSVQEALVREQPARIRHRIDLSSTLLALASIHLRFGRLAAARGDWQRTITLVGDASRQGDADLRQALAHAHLQAARGFSGLRLWHEAAAEFSAALEIAEPADANHWLDYESTLILSGDEPGARRLAARMQDRRIQARRFESGDPAVVIALALGRDLVADAGGLVTAAERNLKAEPANLWNSLALALAEIRAGRFEVAAGRLDAIRTDGDPERSAWFANTPMVWPVLALAEAGRGRRDEALRWLDRSESCLAHRASQGENGTDVDVFDGTAWNDWAAFLVLRDEAWRTIHGARPAEDPRMRLASGVVRAAMGLHDQARADLDLVASAPGMHGDSRPLIELGRVLARAGRAEDADTVFTRAAALIPDDAQPFLNGCWWIAGPLPAECELHSSSDTDPARPVGGTRADVSPMSWIAARTGCGGWIDFQTAFAPGSASEVAGLTWLYATRDRDAGLTLDTAKRAKVWLNGRLIFDNAGRRGATANDKVVVPISLRTGRNTLLVRTVASLDDPVFYAHMAPISGDDETPGGRSVTLVGAEEASFHAWLERIRAHGYRPSYVHGAEVDGRLRLAAIALSNPEGLRWSARIDRGADAFERSYDELARRKHWRVASQSFVTVSGTTHFISVWHEAEAAFGDKLYDRYDLDGPSLRSWIDKWSDTGSAAIGLTGYRRADGVRFAALGGPHDAPFWFEFGWELEPVIAELGLRARQGYHPVSMTAHQDEGSRRFNAVMWRDDPSIRTLARTLNARNVAAVNNELEARGWRPQFLTPTAGDGFFAGWIRHDVPTSGRLAPELAAIDESVQGFLRERGFRGGTLAVAKGGSVVLARGIGFAARSATRPMSPNDPMRLAGLTKVFTAAAVRQLIAHGKLHADSRVADLLELSPPAGRTIDPRWKRITIQHLLDDRGGWRLVNGWDPLFATAEIAEALHRPGPASARDVVDFMVGQPIQYEPGTETAFSNFGYCLLGRVIEQVSGRAYADYLREEILKPIDIRASLARSRPRDRHRHEPEYVHPFRTRDLFESDAKQMVPTPDGGFSVEALDSCGGLLATAADVARFLSRYGVDGQLNPAIDQPQVRFGELPGTFSMALRLPGDVVVVVLCNQNVGYSLAPKNVLAKMMEQAVARVKSWPVK